MDVRKTGFRPYIDSTEAGIESGRERFGLVGQSAQIAHDLDGSSVGGW